MTQPSKVSLVSQGKRADIGIYKIDRLLPNRFVDAVGPFVFLDHILPLDHTNNPVIEKQGTGAHPHRGIATLTYLLQGQADHYDSKGHHAKVRSGGVQWMKAGNGIIHDETITPDPDTEDPGTHGFQFWINLPAKQKAEAAEYVPLQANEVPKIELNNGNAWLKVIAGSFNDITSKIPSYSRQFVYHLHLKGNTLYSLETEKQLEYAAFLPAQDLVINDANYDKGDLLTFESNDGAIGFKNISTAPADVIIFGGEPYTEPIVATGPFVMNTQHEISVAYNEYYDGKYGTITYE